MIVFIRANKAFNKRFVSFNSLKRLHVLNGNLKLPHIQNEPLKSFGPESRERKELVKALDQINSQSPLKVPLIINGKQIFTETRLKQVVCHNHKQILCEYSEANAQHVQAAIEGSLKAKENWESIGIDERCNIFLKAAEILTSPEYRYQMMAATMLGQGKNIWQAEIDAVAELADFWRMNCSFAVKEIYEKQPEFHAPGTWNKMEYRALEGFLLAISPFNFTAIGGNLPSAPALMGNTVLWKPSSSAIYSNYLIMKILMEAGLPPSIIQFLPGPHSQVVQTALQNGHFAGLHFTGSTEVFQTLWKQIASNLSIYKTYPRIVGETGGKNFHFVHESANVQNVVHQTIRSAFEYQGQKCSACSRFYVPRNLWESFIKNALIKEVEAMSVGPVDEFNHFISAVINKSGFDKCVRYIEEAKLSKEITIIAGGKHDASVGYYVFPTVLVSKTPNTKWLKEEIFGPILTVFVYPENEYEKYLNIASETSSYALTGSVFANDRVAIETASRIFYNSCGNFYINDKSTGAVVGQQAFGGARLSGTNDKAGSHWNLIRWVSPRTIKENFNHINHYSYPSNLI